MIECSQRGEGMVVEGWARDRVQNGGRPCLESWSSGTRLQGYAGLLVADM